MANPDHVANVALTDINCGRCGATYAINERYRRQREEKGGFWHCPYCQCSWGYSESGLEKKEKELAEEKRRHQATLARLNEAAASLEKAKKRLRGGVCPCCNRSFVALARHMKTKHPEYIITAP